MRLVHLSDLHLGYRQYQRLTPGGINQREADVAATRLVGAQDLEICEMVQRSYSGGLDPDGVLSTEHETGIAHLHGLLRTALAAPLADPLAVRP